MDQLILLPSVLLHSDNRLVQDDLAALSWPGGCPSKNRRASRVDTGSSFCGTRVTFTGNGTFYVCVKNDGMSDQQPKQNLQAINRSSSSGVAAATGGGGGAGGVNDNRPGSARSNRERHERVILLKERQNSERIKKLEELKEQALAAARLREEQDSKRKKHFEELGRKDDERRRQAEERRRMLDEERRLTLQNKWETKKTNLMSSSFVGSGKAGNKPTYAFGSCTPRLLDNHVDGFLWKSQYNLNVTKEPGMRASSAHDLHLQQKEVRMSTSMYEWNQHRTTPDNPLVHNNSSCAEKRASSHRRKNESVMDTPTRVFCGRRKTDLTPTIPIKRDDYTVMSRSTSRGSGRVYSSMTRLDRSRSPGGITQYQHHGSTNLHHSPQRPSRSKSTTHLQSTGLKLTRTEILRQALATKKEASGIRSVDASRPPSSMSSSIMTSSTHSQVQMRPRTSYVRKTRPASVHVTGVSTDLVSSNDATLLGTKDNTPASSRRSDTPSSVKSTVSRKPSNELRRPATSSSQATTTSGKSSGKTSPNPMTQSTHETSTMKRQNKKKISPTLSNSSSVKAVMDNKQKAKTPEPPAAVADKTPEPPTVAPASDINAGSSNNENELDNKNQVFEQIVEQNQSAAADNKSSKPDKIIENFESIESAFASGSEDFTYSSKTPEPFAPSPGADSATNTVSEVLDKSGRESASTNATIDDSNQEWSNPFITNVTPEPTANVNELKVDEPNSQNKQASPVPPAEGKGEDGADGEGGEAQKPNKIMTEEEAKAALAEKRRLAREAAEREVARIAELERLELERQRLEEEEAERLAVEARRLEEERLRKAIEEEQKRQEEEKRRKEEEEKARQEKERQERAAAKEAERIRLEMEERLRKEEAERLERKRRVEAIMSRTRKKEAEQQQAKSNNSNSNNTSPSELVSQQNDLNGHKDNIILQESIMQSSVNSLNNNFNNNNDFGSSATTPNNDVLDNGTPTSSGASSSTLISFDGMGGGGGGGSSGGGGGVGSVGSGASAGADSTSGNNPFMDNAVDLLNFSQQQTDNSSSSNLSPDLLGSGANPPLVNLAPNNISSGSPNNSIISNPLQEVFIIDLLS